MSWKDGLRQPSFRGIPFRVDEHGAGPYGRRGQLHLYPLRDDGYFEDLGARVPEFQLSAYVDGDDYMARRDRLIEACHRAGPGTLVHPYLGELEVVCTACSPKESVGEGRLARFDLVFVLAGRNRYPTAARDTRAAVVSRGATVTDTWRDRIGGLDVRGPDFLVDAAAELIEEAAGQMLGEARGAGQPLATAVSTLTALSEEAAVLVLRPADLGAQLLAGFASLVGLEVDPLTTLASMKRLARFGEERPAVPRITPTREQQAANEAALLAAVRRQAVVEASAAATRATFVSYNDAAGARTRVTDLIDEEIRVAEVDDDAGFLALKALYAAVVADLSARGATLAPITSFTPRATLPAVVIAYGIYGDAARDEEIVARNRIRHPGFVAGGAPLEILADG